MFLMNAAKLGDVYAGIGSDETVKALKGRYPVFSQNERLFILKSCRYVADAFINSGSGQIDFLDELKRLRPDIFYVNTDGDSCDKRNLCAKLGIEYIVGNREPYENVKRCSTQLKSNSLLPWRVSLAGGWADQPYVSFLHSCSNIVCSIENTFDFQPLAGMSTSTRNKAMELWRGVLPCDDPFKLAKILFHYELRPNMGIYEISGNQDTLGMILPGINRLHFSGDYWPDRIDSIGDETTLDWLESHICLYSTPVREKGYNPHKRKRIVTQTVKQLSETAEGVWQALLARNLKDLGKSVTENGEAEAALFPEMLNRDTLLDAISRMKADPNVLGIKIQGAGGGGYLLLVVGALPTGGEYVKVNIRRG